MKTILLLLTLSFTTSCVYPPQEYTTTSSNGSKSGIHNPPVVTKQRTLIYQPRCCYTCQHPQFMSWSYRRRVYYPQSYSRGYNRNYCR